MNDDPEETPLKANIVFHALTNAPDSKCQLPGTKPQDMVCFLSFENRIPESGKTIYTANICASIRVSGANQLSGFIQRAYWYDYRENEIVFPISSVRKVVVGRCVQGRWFLYGNPNQFPPKPRGTLHSAEVESLPLASASLIAEVKVFNRRTGDVYATERVELSLIDGGFAATVRLT